MNKIIPDKLKIGDEIRVIAPSRTMSILSDNVIKSAKEKLENIGFKVTFGKNVFNSIGEDYKCASILDRADDLHEAFKDKNVKAICWYNNQEERMFISNQGMKVINKGEAEGRIIGGNLCTLNLLQGTEYMPNLKDSILFIEDDGLVGKNFNKEFDRNLQSLLHCAKKQNIKAIIVGRAEKNCEMNDEKWERIFKSKKELENIPIAINSDFGHTTPIFTFPIGGDAKIKIDEDIKIEIED